MKKKLKEKYSKFPIIIDSTNYLKINIPNNEPVILKWENSENEESYKSYDLLFSENGQIMIIEVKSTRSKKSGSFLISGKEWELARQFQDNFFIYRVYDTLSTNPIIHIVQNPYQKWLDRIIIANPVNIKL